MRMTMAMRQGLVHDYSDHGHHDSAAVAPLWSTSHTKTLILAISPAQNLVFHSN